MREMQSCSIHDVHARIEKIRSWCRDRIAKYAVMDDKIAILIQSPTEPEDSQDMRMQPLTYLINGFSPD